MTLFLKHLETYTNGKMTLKTYFNEETKYYESHFSNNKVFKIKTKKLHYRNVLYWRQKFGFKPLNKLNCFFFYFQQKADL
jgi:hypothetical protein